jgi:uncharacterized repeat protein (TIGR03837 family)
MVCSSIDIFCHRVDNFGDVGVAYRFAKEFKAARPSCRVRLFVDDIETLWTIAGAIDTSKAIQEHESITCVNARSLDAALVDALGVSDVMVETFACHIPAPLMELARDGSKLIINLEHLSAEDWVEDYHLKESLLGRGSVRKFYFMPGFRETTGGLILNPRLYGWMDGGVVAGADGGQLVGTVFTYERGFDTLIRDLAALGRETTLLVFGDKSQAGMSVTLERLTDGQRCPIAQCSEGYRQYAYKNIRLVYMPFISQHDYDALLRCTDFNIVRGEDSFARAMLSGKPFIWNAYIQDEKYHLVKVEALLKTMRPYFDDDGAFAAYGELMLNFNGAPAELPYQITRERYGPFFENLKKIEHSAAAIYYFMHRNCDLIKKFCEFLDRYRCQQY